MDVTGKVYIYKSQQYGGYSTLIKNKDGEKMYLSIGFKKGQEPTEDKVQIEITKGFLSFYKTQQGLHKVKVVVMEYNKAQADYTMTEADMSERPF